MDNQRTHRGGPPVDYDSKMALACASLDDILAIEGFGRFKTIKRTDPYYGPKLELALVDDSADERERNGQDEADSPGSARYLLTAGGMDGGLELWRRRLDSEDEPVWVCIDETATAKIDEIPSKPVCFCGELLETKYERSQYFLANECPH